MNQSTPSQIDAIMTEPTASFHIGDDGMWLEGRHGENMWDRESVHATVLAALAEFGPKWLPIEEAPKDGTLIIVSGWDWGVIGSTRHVTITSWRNGGGWWEGEHDQENDDAGCSKELKYLTHWQPFPAPPSPAMPATSSTKEQG